MPASYGNKGPEVLYIKDLWSYAADMSKEKLYSRQEIDVMTGAGDGRLSFWLKQGLLVPASGGEGKGSHRRFERAQVKIAAFLNAASDAGLSITALRPLAAILQEAILVGRHVAAPKRWVGEVAYASWSDEATAADEFKTLLDLGHIDASTAEEVWQAGKRLRRDQSRLFWLAVNLEEDPLPPDREPIFWYVFKDPAAGWQIVSAHEPPPQAHSLPSVMAFNFSVIFRSLGRDGGTS
jgi:DNA-binding transcriptional MerR regulator